MGKIIDGRKIAKDVLKNFEKDILEIKKIRNTGMNLAVLSVGCGDSSKIYINCKKKACVSLGVGFEEHSFKIDENEEKIVNCIKRLNLRKDVTGILVQLPLPKHLNTLNILSNISESKDVDSLNPSNMGKLFYSGYSLEENFAPCTALAVIEILKHERIDPSKKRIAILGRSIIVGKPLACMLNNMDATVTVCHTKTHDLQEICKNCEIIISATGIKNIINEKMVNKNTIVIDVGAAKNSDGKIYGDADFNKVLPIVKSITPVPGGVGPVTVAMLLRNIVLAAKKCIDTCK